MARDDILLFHTGYSWILIGQPVNDQSQLMKSLIGCSPSLLYNGDDSGMWGLFNLETWRNGDLETKANVVITTGRWLAQTRHI